VTVSDAAYTVPVQRLQQLQAAAAADCSKTVHAEASAWTYANAKLAEIAVNASITFLSMTLMCGITGPALCWYGIRASAFLGGFIGALVKSPSGGRNRGFRPWRWVAWLRRAGRVGCGRGVRGW